MGGIKFIRQWMELLKDRKYQLSLLVGIVVMFVAFVLNFEASYYTTQVEALSVGDLILDNIPTLNLNFFYTGGIIIIIGLLIIYPIIFQPEIAPFAIKTFSIFIIVRSFFIILTHIGAPAGFFELAGVAPDSIVSKFFYFNDLFFSAHTGIPFLGALIYWRNRIFRYFLILSSMMMGVTVLFMHIHYSIDVFGAYFITYSIYTISDKIFNKLNLSFKEIVESLEKEEKRIKQFLEKQKKRLLKK